MDASSRRPPRRLAAAALAALLSFAAAPVATGAESLPLPYAPNPGSGATQQPVTGALSWSADGTSATKYVVDLGRTNPPNPNTDRICAAQTTLSCNRENKGTLLMDTTYYWQVTSIDGIGARAGPVWSFRTTAGTSLPEAYNPRPGDGATGQPQTGALQWDADGTGATQYVVDLGRSLPLNGNYDRICAAQAAKSCNRENKGTLLAGTTYYWQVTSIDGIGANPGPVWSFTTAASTNPLPEAYNPAPSHGATGEAVTGNLVWAGEGTSATLWVVDIATQPSFSVPANRICNAQAAKACLRENLGTLMPNTKYYWQATSLDGIGANPGPVWEFTTGAAPPTSLPTPYAPNPADGATGQAQTGPLSWSGDGTSATLWVVDLSTSYPPNPNTDRICAAQAAKSCNRENKGGLIGGTTYYWQATSLDGIGAKAGPIWSFTTGGTPGTSLPTASNPRPADAATGQPLTGPVAWDANGLTQTRYVVDLATDAQYDITTDRICAAQVALSCNRENKGTLLPNTKYYWQVTSIDGIGAKAGPVWTFTTGNSPTPTPASPTPAHGATNQAKTGDLTWSAPGTAETRYAVDLSTANPPDPSTSRICSSITAASCPRAVRSGNDFLALQPSTTYHWRVTTSANGASNPGPVWSFTTAPLAPPTLSFAGTTGYTVDGVNPDVGGSSSSFVFRVRYKQPDGIAPTTIHVVVDGLSYPMTLLSGSGTASDGIYTRSFTPTVNPLARWHHSYHFTTTASSGSDRHPDAGVLEGPDVGAKSSARSGHVVFVHGFQASEGGDATAYWGGVRDRFIAQGWNPANMVFSGFYRCDVNGLHSDVYGKWDATLGPHEFGNEGRSVSANHPSTQAQCSSPIAGGHSTYTSIEHIAYHWAWSISKYQESKGNVCVDVIAHSMGGAVVRYAITAVQEGKADFPTHLCVESVVTLSSPHSPSDSFVVNFCESLLPPGVPDPYQCEEMNGNTDFYQKLAGIAGQNPQGTVAVGTARGTTEWTIVGTTGDGVIPASAATTGMVPAFTVVYNEDISHNSYFNIEEFTSTLASASATVTDRRHPSAYPKQEFQLSPWPAVLADQHAAQLHWGCGTVGSNSGPDEFARLLPGTPLVGEPFSTTFRACGYEVPDVPQGKNIRFRMVSHTPRTWAIWHLNADGTAEPFQCVTVVKATYAACDVPNAKAGRWRAVVDVSDGTSFSRQPVMVQVDYL